MENHAFKSSISRELRKVSPHALKHRIQELFSVDATEALSLDYPVVYFRGTKDYVVPEKNLKMVLSVNPEVKVVEFRGECYEAKF